MNEITVTQTTMTSLELVDYINAGRRDHAEKSGKPCKVLLHKNLMAKIEAHPGIQPAIFLARYHDAKGEARRCYNLPEREARLIVMAESLEVQTKVLDGLIALEAKVKTLEAQTAKLEVMLTQQPKFPSTATPFLTTAIYKELKVLARKDAQLELRNLAGRRMRSFMNNLMVQDSAGDETWEDSPAHVDLIVMQTLLYLENAAKFLEVESKAKGRSLTPNLDGHTYVQPRLSTQVTPEQSLLKP